MSIILFRKGTGDPVKVSEYGFEHSVASGNYFLTKDEALGVVKPVAVEVAIAPAGGPALIKNVELDPVTGLSFNHNGMPPPSTPVAAPDAAQKAPYPQKRKYNKRKG